MTTTDLLVQLRAQLPKREYISRLEALREKLNNGPIKESLSDCWDSHHDHSNHVDNNDDDFQKTPNEVAVVLRTRYQESKAHIPDLNTHTDFNDHSDFSDTGVS